jgi:hypothetical protein
LILIAPNATSCPYQCRIEFTDEAVQGYHTSKYFQIGGLQPKLFDWATTIMTPLWGREEAYKSQGEVLRLNIILCLLESAEVDVPKKHWLDPSLVTVHHQGACECTWCLLCKTETPGFCDSICSRVLSLQPVAKSSFFNLVIITKSKQLSFYYLVYCLFCWINKCQHNPINSYQ